MATQTPPDFEFGLDEVAAALFMRAGITHGTWRLAARLQFAGLTMNLQNPADGPVRPMPAGVVGLDGLALFAVKEGEGGAGADLIFDASEVLAKKTAQRPRATPKRAKSTKPAG